MELRLVRQQADRTPVVRHRIGVGARIRQRLRKQELRERIDRLRALQALRVTIRLPRVAAVAMQGDQVAECAEVVAL